MKFIYRLVNHNGEGASHVTQEKNIILDPIDLSAQVLTSRITWEPLATPVKQVAWPVTGPVMILQTLDFKSACHRMA
jgi:hypothetical protein